MVAGCTLTAPQGNLLNSRMPSSGPCMTPHKYQKHSLWLASGSRRKGNKKCYPVLKRVPNSPEKSIYSISDIILRNKVDLFKVHLFPVVSVLKVNTNWRQFIRNCEQWSNDRYHFPFLRPLSLSIELATLIWVFRREGNLSIIIFSQTIGDSNYYGMRYNRITFREFTERLLGIGTKDLTSCNLNEYFRFGSSFTHKLSEPPNDHWENSRNSNRNSDENHNRNNRSNSILTEHIYHTHI